MDRDDEFRLHLMETFKTEAAEHVANISNMLIQIEENKVPDQMEMMVESIFREAHSLKGASRAVDFHKIETICQAVESVFNSLKKKEIHFDESLFDLLHKAIDFIDKVLKSETVGHEQDIPEGQELAKALEEKSSNTTVIKKSGQKKAHVPTENKENKNSDVKINEVPSKSKAFKIKEPPLDNPPVIRSIVKDETVRVSTSRLTSVLLQAEELISVKLAAKQKVRDLHKANAEIMKFKKEWSKMLPVLQELKIPEKIILNSEEAFIRADRTRTEEGISEFLEWSHEQIKEIEQQYNLISKAAERESTSLETMVNALLDDMKQVMMFPFSSVLESFPKTVRDLAKENGKNIFFQVKGSEIEIDRRILEEIKDPLMHMVRNSIDHGIEKSDLRRKRNKTEQGNIIIEILPKDQKVEVIFSDDGGGIDLEQVKYSIITSGSAAKEQIDQMPEEELIKHIFQSGISTSPLITDLSGRGLGLAIVREKIEKLGGTIAIESAYGEGTRFQMNLPLTVATFRGVQVSINERLFVLPTLYVERVIRFGKEDIQTVESCETIIFNGCPVALVRLAAVLGIEESGSDSEGYDMITAVVLNTSGMQIAFVVDTVVNEQEVLFKNLGKQLVRVKNIAGATVLGNGKTVPLLNVPDLMKSAIRAAASPVLNIKREAADDKKRKKPLILVAEDSITTRMLLKNILETSGYQVITAIDGREAYSKLRKTSFDVVISDVDMPYMNGFELTAKIRKDSRIKNIPVILITALASKEDQERGVEAGANAYIIKSNFDQSNLIEVLKRLVT